MGWMLTGITTLFLMVSARQVFIQQHIALFVYNAVQPLHQTARGQLCNARLLSTNLCFIRR